jgi:alpha-1,6-mannosyltransferase
MINATDLPLARADSNPFWTQGYGWPLTLALIGGASAGLYVWSGDLHWFTQWIAAYIMTFIGHFALYLIACMVVLRMPVALPRGVKLATLAIIIIFAGCFRAQLVNKRPYLSTDTYRYIWDGRVQAAGINPYRYVPSAPELAHLREDKIYPNINRGDYAPTPYPPIAQAIYLGVYLAHPLSITAFRVAMSLFDMLTMLSVMLVLARAGLNPARAIIFAWHPLLIWEGAHSGHVESAFIAFLALALLARVYKKPVLVGVMLGLAAMVKFYPGLLLPAMMFSYEGLESSDAHRKTGWLTKLVSTILSKPNIKMVVAFMATIVASYIPYLSVGRGVFGYLPNEFAEEGYVEGGTRYFLYSLIQKVAPLPTTVFIVLAALALLGCGLWWIVRRKRDATDIARGAIALIGLYLLLTTPRYPWYYAWIIPFLCFAPRAGWLYLTGATILLYLLWYIPNVYPHLPIWLGLSVYGPTLALLAWHYLRARRLDNRSARLIE